MTSRVSWSVDGIEPSVRERAEAAARRAGMSLGDWLNSMIGTPNDAHDVADIHRRLDSISRQMENISRAPNGSKNDPGVARQLNDAISRLDERLSQISGRTSTPSYRPSPSIAAPQMQQQMDFSIAEIVARQGELDGAPRTIPQRMTPMMPAPTFVAPVYAPPMQPQADFSGLERQLSHMTDRIEMLRRPDPIMEQSIASFRSELADIRHAIMDAMPRRAIESLESEVRSLGRRIDETRSGGVDGAALSGVERALAEIRGELRSLTPAEKLTGFDEAINHLGAKIDMIVRTSPDPGIVHQLEDAIAALKLIVSNIASNDTLHQLADHIQMLSAKVDQVARSGGSEILSALEQRIATLTSALESRERPAAGDSSYFDNAVRNISDRLDSLQVGGDSASSLGHVEQRVHHLLERLEHSGNSGGNLGRVEEALSDILRHLEQQRLNAAAGQPGAPMDVAVVDTIKRELTDMRYSQSETDRHTQDSLEVVHSTLGHVVDRLAQIEGDLRDVRSAPRAMQSPEPARREAVAPESARPQFAMPRPELPNPAAAQPPIARSQISEDRPSAAPTMADVTIAGEHIGVAETSPATRPPSAARNPIDPSLPPDTPLEPGTRPQQVRGTSTPSERIAASEIALSEIPAGTREPVSTSNFIQAARRAAQAAATAPEKPAAKKANRVTSLNDAARTAAKVAATGESPLSSKIRGLLVGASVVVIVLGTVKFGMNLLNGRDTSPPAASSESSDAAPLVLPSAREGEPHSENVSPITPSMTSPTPIDRQSMNGTSPLAAPAQPGVTVAPKPPAANPQPSPDITGSIAVPAERVSVTASPAAPSHANATLTPVSDKIPESIGGIALRTAANKGDPAAAFEIGVRYSEGRGVAANYEEAAKWYARASDGGIVPATFRLGALYEKGLGTKKDVEAARRYYMQAAERGSAKAMHNLAVLDADGGSTGPNYKGAAQWFRKAAERGVADSQFNLAVLYARGIGVEQNLAESFKWFSLAAAQGDAESGRKRDDVAKRLDPQSLAAAKLAIQTFTPETQPDEAIATGAPAGGWDAAPAPKTSAKTSDKATKTKSAAR